MSSQQDPASSSTTTNGSHSQPKGRRAAGAGRGRQTKSKDSSDLQPTASSTPSLPTPTPPTSTSTTTTSTTSTTSNTSSTAPAGSEEEQDVCLICCEAIECYGVGPCNHREVCALCTLKRRDLYQELNCCICKAPMPSVIYTKDSEKPYEDFVLHSFIYDTKRNSHFESEEFYKRVMRLWEYKCQVCAVPAYAHLEPLKKHLKREHKLMYCDLCVTDRKVFFAEQQVYTHAELMKHMLDWDGGVGEPSKDSMRWKGHPMCEFCSKHFYGMDQLYKHLQESHFTCHVCEKANVLYQYYRDYADLERHFTTEHFPCTHPDCLAQKFVFFGSVIDLKAHQLSHSKKGGSRNDRQLELNFTYLRAGRSGEGVDDPLERNYRHKTRRRDAGFDSDPEDSQQAASSSTGGSKKKGKSKKPLSTSANEVRTADTTESNGNSNNSNAHNRPGRAPQSFAPGFRNKGTADTASAVNGTDAEPDLSKEQEARERERSIKELQERERAEREQQQIQQQIQQMQQMEEIQKERNKQLVKDLKLAIGDAAYTTLREASGEYRAGAITAREYYAALYGFLRHYPQLLVQLVALLPDENKKNALERVHSEYLLWEDAYPSLENDFRPKSKAKGKGKDKARPVGAWDVPKKATLPSFNCQICGDLIPGADKEKHDYFHMQGAPIISLSASPPPREVKFAPQPVPAQPPTPSAPEPPPVTRPLPNTDFPPPPSSSQLLQQEQNFPSLSTTTASMASLSVGAWNRGKGQGLQSKDFPSLQTNSTQSATEFDDDDGPVQTKRAGGKKKKKNQVLIHFG